MQDLRVIGVESGALLVATDAGSEFRLPVTLSLHSQLRAANPDHSVTAHKVPPREIQASIRGGKSAEQVAQSTGVELDYVRRFEGPVLAERSFVLETARAVPVSIGGDGGAPAETSKFGEVIDSRLDAAEATERDWTSYKDPATGWVVHVTYTTQEVEREATWRFDPKKQSLAPLNGDAHTLSRQDSRHTPLVPRLRAVGGEAGPNESGRFDSGAFEVGVEAPETTIDIDETPVEQPTPFDRSREGRSAASVAAMNRAPETAPAHNQTADLLEALRRRRGEREAARFDDGDHAGEGRSGHPSTGSLRVIDVPLDDFNDSSDSAPAEPPRTTKPIATHPTASRSVTPRSPEQPAKPNSPSRTRKGRASMPSWDEIVFGARSDDDPA
jgi:hypothetical protein